MVRNIRRMKSTVVAIVLLLALVFQSACGTLLYPERRGQSGGQIDPAVAILNGVGVLLFIIPGLIAFAVDFSTGAIYLPPDESDENARRQVIHLDPAQLTPEKLSAAIQEHTGREVTLTERDIEVLRVSRAEAMRW